MKLLELFKSAYEYKITKDEETLFVAKFETDDGSKVEVHIEGDAEHDDDLDAEDPDYENQNWDVAFFRTAPGKPQSIDVTGDGDAPKILATVVAILGDFHQQTRPKTVNFSAEEPSRIKLYKAMATRFGKMFNYTLKQSPSGKLFYLIRNKA